MYHNRILQTDKENRRCTKWISKHFGGMKTKPTVPVLSMFLCVSFSIIIIIYVSRIVPYSSTSVPSKLLSRVYDLLVVVGCSFFITSLENSILWSIDKRIYQLINLSIYPFINSAIHQFINSSIHRFINSSIHQFLDSSIHRFIDSSIH